MTNEALDDNDKMDEKAYCNNHNISANDSCAVYYVQYNTFLSSPSRT